MTNKTVTRAQLADTVRRKVRLSRAECTALVEMLLNEIMACLERSEAVKLSSFGNFVVRVKAARVGRNPKTGATVPITARRVLVFKPSPFFKHSVDVGAARQLEWGGQGGEFPLGDLRTDNY